MTDFTIMPYFSINNIGSASGIVYINNKLFIISDNSGFLYEYILDNKNLYTHQIIENAEYNIIKKDKPDFESICLKNNNLYIYGSGSTKKRELRIKFNLLTQEVKTKDLTKFYNKLKKKANFSDDDLNIEGSFFYKQNLYLLNRGNGQMSKNGIFICNKAKKFLEYKIFQLPKINNFETTFTDGVVVENKIYFLATAENTTSTYLDGEIYGSIVGIIDLEKMVLEKYWQVSNNQKFEGLTFFSKHDNEITFLVCEDNDTEKQVSDIYQLKINLT